MTLIYVTLLLCFCISVITAEVVGSSYGGWIVDESRLNERSIVYSFGLGTDITFDKALIQRYNLHVYGFDNTPIASRYLEKTTLPPNFHWVKVLLWHNNTILTMSLPRAHGVSMTAAEIGSVRDGRFAHHPMRQKFNLRARCLETIMKMLGHKRIDVLKIDIEGAEFAIVEAWVAKRKKIHACQLLLETHERFYAHQGEMKLERLREQLSELGFVYKSDKGDMQHGREFLFIKESECEESSLS
eukprot:CAMPEP_0174328496 /NCGR_PEP_ID=MMETSP0810-20121108/15178_1 /TAXON_ID=73025 ORGANISM="Eutreptiella gymnastica-like, Strain CCMP1594" /NCGR_SAMPLE_ID=MMETSP0810 /ASSEMBLY_ACC=CAM_ASM_000659 /LENGTH=242 /DNA_ID=CAMNT_0015442607 /DNA_START=15 /DNA_END=743 /DNA_ORIENTATION=+